MTQLETFFKDESLRRMAKLGLALIALAAGILFYLSFFENTFIDDAFITFQYAANLRYHGHWGFLLDQISNTATSPLNVALLALLGFFAPDIPRAALWLSTLEALALCVLFIFISRKIFGGIFFAVVSFVAMMTNPLLMSTLGLEPLLYAVFIVAAICVYLYRKWNALAIILALLTLTRPDGALLSVIFLFSIHFNSETKDSLLIFKRFKEFFWVKKRLMFLTMYLACLFPWYLFSWVYFGSALPATFFIKANFSLTGNPFGDLIQMYYVRYRIETLTSFSMIILIPAILFAKNSQSKQVLALLFFFGAAYYVSYRVLNVFPFHWYLAPVVVAAALSGALAISALRERFQPHSISRIAFYVVPVYSTIGILLFFQNSPSFPPAEAPIHTNWASAEQYRDIGLWLKNNLAPTSKIRLDAETGTLAYYSERLVYNYFGCQQDIQARLHKFDNMGSVIRQLMKINLLFLKPSQPCGPYDYTLGFDFDMSRPIPSDSLHSWEITSKWTKRGKVFLVPR